MAKIDWKALSLLVTWPYFRTFRHHIVRPSQRLAECPNRALLQYRIQAWLNSKSHELRFVKVASTVSAAATVTVFSWPQIIDAYWLASALWYISMASSISALVLSAQQTSIIDSWPSLSGVTLSSEELLQLRLMILRGRNVNVNQAADDRMGGLVPEKLGLGAGLMLFVWQSPMMLMSWSWVTFLLALTIYICTPFIEHQPWGPGHKVAYFYLCSAALLLAHFVGSSAYAYHIPEGVNQAALADVEIRMAQSASQKAHGARLEPGAPPFQEGKDTADETGRTWSDPTLQNSPMAEEAAE